MTEFARRSAERGSRLVWWAAVVSVISPRYQFRVFVCAVPDQWEISRQQCHGGQNNK